MRTSGGVRWDMVRQAESDLAAVEYSVSELRQYVHGHIHLGCLAVQYLVA